MTQAEALSILTTGANVFLTGEPGSGKTYTIQQYVAWLRARGIEPAITASTGIAATHIHGMTIHAWSGIGVRDGLSPMDIDAIASKEHVARRVQKATTLIIDEISMLSAPVLSLVDAVCREVKRTDLPFGGMQVVLVGDFYQLPPISKGNERPAFAFESRTWKELNLIPCYLTEQHRQDDRRFLSVLSSIRAADPDPTTVSVILSRESEIEGFDEDVPRLYTHNIDVDRVNHEKLDTLPGVTKRFAMDSSGAPPLIEALKRGCLSPESLLLKEGAVVMGTKNVPILGLANGTLGKVIGFEKGSGYPQVELQDGRSITVPPVEWAIEEGGKARAKVAQVPLRLAWAITVHKSQGMSMDAAAIDLSRAFEYGQGYVALSRVRTLDGLYILGWSEQALAVHPLVVANDEEFRDATEAATTAFAELEKSGERLELEKQFVKASGGDWEAGLDESGAGRAALRARASKPRISTYDETQALITLGKDLDEVAQERALTFGTIVGHVEKLVASGTLTRAALRERLPQSLIVELPRIHAAFKKKGSEKLTPLYGHFNAEIPFENLRLARLLYESD